MAIINSIIPKQNFELVRDQIGRILRDELDNQADGYGVNEDLVVKKVYKERDIPFNSGETPAVNVMVDRVDYELQSQVRTEGMHRFLIEVTVEGRGNNDTGGDTKAMVKCQRLVGVVRAILMNPKYVRLGFEPGFIMNRHVQSIEFGKPIRQDSAHTVMGRIALMVKMSETTELSTPTVAAGFFTGVRIEETDLGYLFVSYNS